MKNIIFYFDVSACAFLFDLPGLEFSYMYKDQCEIDEREWGRIRTENVTFKIYGVSMAKEKFIQNMDMKKGALRKSLHVKKGEKIPEKKLEKAEHSKNPTTRKRAVLAKTLKKLHK